MLSARSAAGDLELGISDHGHPHNLGIGFGAAATPLNLVFCLFGCLIGTLIGVLPGIGPIATIAMLLPVTFSLSPLGALIMLAGIYYGAQYGGSTTAILVNLPGESSSVVTCIEGYRMAQKGRAGAALGVAAIGSFFAGCVGTILIAAFAPILAKFAEQFRSPEYFSLMLFGLVAAVVLAHGSVIKAVAMIVLGLLIGLDRHRYAKRRRALHLRRAGTLRRRRFRARRHGPFRLCRDHEQPRSRRRSSRRPRENHQPVADARGNPARHSRGPARHCDRLVPWHPAGRRRGAVVVRGLHPGEEGLAVSPRIRHRRDRRRCRTGIRQQCRRANVVHSAAHAWHSLDAGDGVDDGRDDHSGHCTGHRDHHRTAGTVLGHDHRRCGSAT